MIKITLIVERFHAKLRVRLTIRQAKRKNKTLFIGERS